MTGNGSSSVQTLDRTLDVLMLFYREKRELGVSEIARELGAHKSAVHRILATLERRGFAQKNPETAKYWLGVKFYCLGSLYENRMTLKDLAAPHARALAGDFNEAVHVAVLDSAEADSPKIVLLDKIETQSRLSMTPPAGSLSPPHCSSVGKVLLAHASPRVLERITVEPLERFTENTITDPAALMVELESIRQNGYALDREELEIGLTCVAAPIFNHREEVTAAISLSGPTVRMIPRLQEIIAAVRACARQISQTLR